MSVSFLCASNGQVSICQRMDIEPAEVDIERRKVDIEPQ